MAGLLRAFEDEMAKRPPAGNESKSEPAETPRPYSG
jgi:hypothetical protein